MKKLIMNILLLSGVLLTSCSDDGDVKIVSLNTFGNKVCMNDRVKVFVSAETSGDEVPTYEWGCSEGSMTNPQGLFENVWQAPKKPGEYEIWVTVKCGGSKETRRAKMTVLDELFYSDFETPYYNEGYSNSSMTLAQDSKTGSLKLTSSKDKGVFQRNWNDETIVPPYSMQMQYNPQTFKDGNSIDFRIAFSSLSEGTKDLRNINFSIEPLTGNTYIYSQYFNKETGDIESLETSVTVINDLKFTKSWKYVSVSIDASNNFIVYLNGVKIVESTFLKTFFPQSSYPIKGSGVALSNKAVVLVDDMSVIINGEICNATERVR